MNKSAPDSKPGKRSVTVWIFYAYITLILAGCFYPARTGIITLRTTFNVEIFAWSAYVPLSDIIINLLMYIPIGILLMVIFRKQRSLQGAIFRAILVGTAISIGVEFVQYFITDRVSSALDVILNFGGTSIGVVFAIVLERFSRSRTRAVASAGSVEE